MHRHPNHRATLLLGVTLTAAFALAGAAFAGDALPDRPGFGYAIQFMSSSAAEALLPVPRQRAMIVRPGFGYVINFMPGDPAELVVSARLGGAAGLGKPAAG